MQVCDQPEIQPSCPLISFSKHCKSLHSAKSDSVESAYTIPLTHTFELKQIFSIILKEKKDIFLENLEKQTALYKVYIIVCYPKKKYIKLLTNIIILLQ